MLNRHSLVYIHSGVSPCSEHQDDELTFFKQWITKGWPLIYTRQLNQSSEYNIINLGLPYFDAQSQTKYRYSYSVTFDAIQQVTSLPKLVDIFPKLKEVIPLAISVYGSYAWEYMTHIQYVQATSDLDLLIDYQDESLVEISTSISQIRQFFPQTNIDGEIRLPDLGDCQIFELLDQDSNDILFKTANDVILVTREQVYAQYPKLANT